ncbi:MAG: hypothetical protein JWN44_7210 [Myxococcales bacterium]|nr:hypothetical protein [Myxococcales bacterium]
MSKRPPFRIPPSFIVARVLLKPWEIAFGFRTGWLSAADVVTLVLAKLEAKVFMTSAEHRLALLRGGGALGDLYELQDLIDDLEKAIRPSDDPAAVWLFLALDWVHDHRTDFEDALGMVEVLFAEFGYPSEMQGFVRFMPAGSDIPVGLAGIESRWRSYLQTKRKLFGAR